MPERQATGVLWALILQQGKGTLPTPAMITIFGPIKPVCGQMAGEQICQKSLMVLTRAQPYRAAVFSNSLVWPAPRQRLCPYLSQQAVARRRAQPVQLRRLLVKR